MAANEDPNPELQNMLESLKKQLIKSDTETSSSNNDSIVEMKFQLLVFVNNVYVHNQSFDWETNKTRSKSIKINDIISGAEKLYAFVSSN